MRPIDQYITIRRGQLELRKQAECERIIRTARLKKWMNSRFYRKLTRWIGIHLVTWGQKLERFGSSGETYTPSHH